MRDRQCIAKLLRLWRQRSIFHRSVLDPIDVHVERIEKAASAGADGGGGAGTGMGHAVGGIGSSSNGGGYGSGVGEKRCVCPSIQEFGLLLGLSTFRFLFVVSVTHVWADAPSPFLGVRFTYHFSTINSFPPPFHPHFSHSFLFTSILQPEKFLLHQHQHQHHHLTTLATRASLSPPPTLLPVPLTPTSHLLPPPLKRPLLPSTRTPVVNHYHHPPPPPAKSMYPPLAPPFIAPNHYHHHPTRLRATSITKAPLKHRYQHNQQHQHQRHRQQHLPPAAVLAP